MAFCSTCGTKLQEDAKFCGSCGTQVGAAQEQVIVKSEIMKTTQNVHEEYVIWEGKPAGLTDRIKDKAKVNSTSYTLTNQRIIIKSGLIGKKVEEIELIKLKDIKLDQSIKDRLIGVGTLTIVSIDNTTPILHLVDIKDANAVKDLIRKAAKDEKSKYNVQYRESL